MGTLEVVGIITAIIPFVTKIVKNWFRTEIIKEPYRKGINALIPVVIGILSSGLYAFSQGQDWVTALAIGLGSGGAASSARDIEKNLIRLVEVIAKILKK